MSSSGQSGEGLLGTVLQESFRLTRLIGQGGMGTVYEGTQLRLNKRVAVKVLARQLASNQEALARFRREAEVTSQLGHPHIVQVFDFGTAPSGEPYLVMEYLEGEDLDQRIRRTGRLRLASAVGIVKQVASALSSTHARGIVHRDLKPANIFVLEIEGETDFVKIVDFGISKVRAASVRLTGALAVIGTPNYMSPEQAAGKIDEIDHKTDQWSLACIAFEMLAGRGPFVGDTVHSLLYQVIHQEPPRLTAMVPGLPGEVEQVIGRALSKRQADRFATVSAFSRAFAAAAAGVPVTTDSGSIALAATAARVPVVDAESPKSPVLAPPVATPRSPSTTLSRTASEMMASLSRFRARLPSKRVAAVAAGFGFALLTGGLILHSHSATPRVVSGPSVNLPPAAVSSVPVIIAPLAPPTPAPAPPPSVANIPPPAPPEVPSTIDRVQPPRASIANRPRSTAKADSAAHKEPPPRAKPAKADAATNPPPSIGQSARKTPPPTPAPKRHLIEDL